MRISFIGGGKMGEAMIAGILDAGVAKRDGVRIGEPVEERRDYLATKFVVDVQRGGRDVLDGADLVVLALQPRDLAAAMTEISPGLEGGQVVMSIVAGARMDTLTSGLHHRAVIRVMNNMPDQTPPNCRYPLMGRASRSWISKRIGPSRACTI